MSASASTYKQKRAEYGRIWRAAHKQERAEYGRIWRAAHPEYMREARAKQPEKHREYARAHPERRRARYAAHPEREHKRYLKKEYGLTLPQWEDMLVRQSGRCAVCRTPMFSPHVDHNHTTGKVRGLLCKRCNLAEGYMRNSARAAGVTVSELGSLLTTYLGGDE